MILCLKKEVILGFVTVTDIENNIDCNVFVLKLFCHSVSFPFYLLPSFSSSTLSQSCFPYLFFLLLLLSLFIFIYFPLPFFFLLHITFSVFFCHILLFHFLSVNPLLPSFFQSLLCFSIPLTSHLLTLPLLLIFISVSLQLPSPLLPLLSFLLFTPSLFLPCPP